MRKPLVVLLIVLALLGLGFWIFSREEARTLFSGDAFGARASPAFSPDGTKLSDGVSIWDLAAGKASAALEDAGPTFHLVFSPDGKLIAGGKAELAGRRITRQEAVLLWDAASGKLLRRTPGVKAWALAFSPDARLLATAGGEGEDTVQLWDAATGAAKSALPGHRGGAYSLAFSADGRRIAVGGGSPGGPGLVKVWDIEPAKVVCDLAASTPVEAVAFSPDGKSLAAAASHQDREHQGVVELSLWEVESGKLLEPGGGGGSGPLSLVHQGQVLALSFSSDCATLAIGIHRFDRTGWISKMGEVLLCDARTLTCKRTLEQGPGVYSLGWSRDSRWLASGGLDGSLKLWDLTSAR
jgi:WD40 repeat protein